MHIVSLLQALCLGLCLNTSVTRLELRGNNVRGPGTEHLATLLRKNKHLQSLTLEWNNLGGWSSCSRGFNNCTAASVMHHMNAEGCEVL